MNFNNINQTVTNSLAHLTSRVGLESVFSPKPSYDISF